MHKASDSDEYRKLCDVISFPDLGEDAETLDSTTLSDAMRTSVLGIQENGGMSFEANYDRSVFAELKQLERRTEQYGVWFGAPEGEGASPGDSGKFLFSGQLSTRVTGGGVNEVLRMNLFIAPSSAVVHFIISALKDNEEEDLLDSSGQALLGLYM